MYINSSLILHIINEATQFQATYQLQNISAKHTQDMLQACWINTYISPPNHITYNASKNFVSKEFIGYANLMAISTKSVLVEAHQLVGLVERAYPTLQRAYQVILDELYSTLTKDLVLQMAVKAVNDTTSPNRLVLTLLVFSAYPRMTKLDPPTPLITA